MTDPVKDTYKLAEEVFGDIHGKEWRAQVAVQARIIMAKNNIKYLQRYERLVKRGLTEIKDNLHWWQLYSYLRWGVNWLCYDKSMRPQIKELVANWERVIKFPNNLILKHAENEHAKFCQNYRKSLAIMRTLPNQDMMEM